LIVTLCSPFYRRYIAERFLPDKAIDLVDEAAAKLKIEVSSKPEAIDELDRKIIQLQMGRCRDWGAWCACDDLNCSVVMARL
jgi:ATP-dependent Clp protease ATP-binding subunit ClpA